MNDWIPVCERNPDRADWYFVTEVLDTVNHDRIVTEAFYNAGTGWCTNDSRSMVVAWMPKISPYRGDTRGDWVVKGEGPM